VSAALDAHAREFPAGCLAEEREALAVHALAAHGRTREVSARARAFRMRHTPVYDEAATERHWKTLVDLLDRTLVK
jgi:dienelactone hydrolase